MESQELYTEDERAADRLVKSAEARGGFAEVMILRTGELHVVAFWPDEIAADLPDVPRPGSLSDLDGSLEPQLETDTGLIAGIEAEQIEPDSPAVG